MIELNICTSFAAVRDTDSKLKKCYNYLLVADMVEASWILVCIIPMHVAARRYIFCMLHM